jgi:hypothetical protein
MALRETIAKEEMCLVTVVIAMVVGIAIAMVVVTAMTTMIVRTRAMMMAVSFVTAPNVAPVAAVSYAGCPVLLPGLRDIACASFPR